MQVVSKAEAHLAKGRPSLRKRQQGGGDQAMCGADVCREQRPSRRLVGQKAAESVIRRCLDGCAPRGPSARGSALEPREPAVREREGASSRGRPALPLPRTASLVTPRCEQPNTWGCRLRCTGLQLWPCRGASSARAVRTRVSHSARGRGRRRPVRSTPGGKEVGVPRLDDISRVSRGWAPMAYLGGLGYAPGRVGTPWALWDDAGRAGGALWSPGGQAPLSTS